MDHLSPVWTHLTHIKVVRGEGIYLFDEQGNKYTDFTSGIGVANTGHTHPRISAAIKAQADKLLFGQMNCVISDKAVELSEKLNQITPPHINRFFFSNSGAEATEACVKLAKAATGRTNIIVFQGSFHGRTHLAMAMTTSKTVYRHKFQPLPGGIFVAPFPYHYQYGWTEDQAIKFCIKQLDILLKGQTAPDETAAIIIEPVLGEGGYVPVPAAFLKHLRKVCDEHGIMLVIDEVQSGFGRTGKFFCFEHANVMPDILVMAKGLGSGLPISAIGSSEKIMNKWTPGTHGGTYGGGSLIPLAAACETVDTIIDEKLVENAAERGQQLVGGLKYLQKHYPVLGDIRGHGLMIGTEFTDREGNPDAATAKAVMTYCLEHKMLMLLCGTYGNVIRWIPPLVISKDQIASALSLFEKALEKVAK